jgi:predicted small lipoprotein YifL
LQKECFVSRNRPYLYRALIGTLVVTLGLAACGRKGPLDPPPAASLAGDQGAAKSSGGPLVIDREGRPTAPPGPNKRIPLDVLLN